MFERVILRIGAVAFLLGLVAVVVFESLHPAREDPNDNPLVFAEYAQYDHWTTVHLGQFAGALLLITGIVALCASLLGGRSTGASGDSGRRGGGAAAWASLATVLAGVAAAAYGVLQVVDGVALKRAVDAWAAAPGEDETAAFAAAETVRWIEYGLNSLAYSLVGLTVVLVGFALLTSDRFPRLLGAWAIAAGVAYVVKGLGVAYRGFSEDPSGLVALALFGSWVLVVAPLMWRRSSRLGPRKGKRPSDASAP